MTVRAAGNNNDPSAIVAPTGLELKSGFKKTIKWNKYRSQMSVQNNNNNLNYLIDPTFTKVNRLFVCHLKELKKTMLKKIIEILFHIIMYLKLK